MGWKCYLITYACIIEDHQALSRISISYYSIIFLKIINNGMWTGIIPYSAILKKSSREHQNANGFNIIFPHRVKKEGMFILQKIPRINEGVWKHGQLDWCSRGDFYPRYQHSYESLLRSRQPFKKFSHSFLFIYLFIHFYLLFIYLFIFYSFIHLFIFSINITLNIKISIIFTPLLMPFSS